MSAAGGEIVVYPHEGMTASNVALRPGLARADRRMVTAFFCDVVESSKLVIPQDPEDAYDQLSGLIDIMQRHVLAFGGTVCQTLGDGIYAIFGAPIALENHAVRACFAADAILREVARGNRAVRIGICSGEVLWDHSLAGRQSSSPATGAAIHIAAKMQQSAPPNAARLADSTARLAADWVDTRPSMLLALGGIEPTQSHELLGLRGRRRHSDDDLPMVGREHVRRQLLSAITHIETDEQSSFSAHLVQGAPGLGKTRLMRALADTTRSRGFRVIEWQVPVVEPVGALNPLQRLVIELLDGPLPRTVAGISAMLRGAGAAGEEADALARILLPASEEWESSGGAAVLTVAMRALAALVGAAASRRPLLLLVEDVQWADSAVQAVLSTLLNLPEKTRLVLVMSCRDDGSGATIGDHPRLRRHSLVPLGGPDVALLLDLWMGRAPALDAIKADLARRSRGNPLFLVECIRVLLMNGTLLGDVGEMVPGVAAEYTLPDTVQTLLTVRVDLLDEEARDLLRAASVIGQTFDAGLLSSLVGDDLMRRRIPDLVRVGLIDETRLLPRQEYSFHHALMYETVHAGVTRWTLRQLNARLAELLDRPEQAELPGRLAAQTRHAFRGELWAMAVHAGRDAGMEALARSLAPEAVSLLSIAIQANDKLGDLPQSRDDGIDLRVALARAAMPAGQGERAMVELELAVRQAQSLGDDRRALNGLVQQVNFERVYGYADRAVALAETALRLSGGPLHAHPELLVIAAASHIELGESEKALELLDIAQRAGPEHLSGRYTVMDPKMIWSIIRATCLSLLGQDEDAEPLIQTALELADTGAYPFNRIYVRAYASQIRMRQRRFGDVLALSSEGLTISRATGSTLMDSLNLARRGLALAHMGRVAGGLVDIENSLRQAHAGGATMHIAWARHARAVALALAGRLDEALQERKQVLSLVEERNYGLLRLVIPAEADFAAMARQLPTGGMPISLSTMLH